MTVYIYGAKRTAIGKFNGQFKKTPATKLASIAIKSAIEQSNIPSVAIEEVILGHVLQAGTGQGPARQAMLEAGLSDSVTAFSVNKLCGSGLKAVMLGAQAIKAGDKDIVVVGGMENMTCAPHLLSQARQGYRLGGGEIQDHMLRDGLHDAFENYHMGITAENIADKYNISREEQDEFAYKSQTKAIHAIESGLFKQEITAVHVPSRKGDIICDQDEHPSFGIEKGSLEKLRPAFKKDGSVTAGNSSGINDGAAALVLGNEKGIKMGAQPLAKIIAYAEGAMDPSLMGLTPTIAIKAALEKADMNLNDIELIELNEAFAVQSLGVLHELKESFNINDSWIEERVNITGGAIALGHPIGASGARVLTTLLYSMIRQEKMIGMASLCIGGGLAVAMIIERIIPEKGV